MYIIKCGLHLTTQPMNHELVNEIVDKRVPKTAECLSTQMFKSKLKVGTRVLIHRDVYAVHGKVEEDRAHVREKSGSSSLFSSISGEIL